MVIVARTRNTKGKMVYVEAPSKVRTIKEFRIFLATECFDGKKYLQGKYDKKIYDWFKK